MVSLCDLGSRVIAEVEVFFWQLGQANRCRSSWCSRWALKLRLDGDPHVSPARRTMLKAGGQKQRIGIADATYQV